MRTHVADHPLIAHKLTALRDEQTDSPTFRRLADELVTLLAYEATRDVRTSPVEIITPVAPDDRGPPRCPQAAGGADPAGRPGDARRDDAAPAHGRGGFLGMIRDEHTLQASTYATRLPEDLSGRQCYVLDPMLATGGTLVAALTFLLDRGADDITAICLLAAPEGLAVMEKAFGSSPVPVAVVTAGWTSGSTSSATSFPRARRRGRPPVRRGLTSVDGAVTQSERLSASFRACSTLVRESLASPNSSVVLGS